MVRFLVFSQFGSSTIFPFRRPMMMPVATGHTIRTMAHTDGHHHGRHLRQSAPTHHTASHPRPSVQMHHTANHSHLPPSVLMHPIANHSNPRLGRKLGHRKPHNNLHPHPHQQHHQRPLHHHRSHLRHLPRRWVLVTLAFL